MFELTEKEVQNIVQKIKQDIIEEEKTKKLFIEKELDDVLTYVYNHLKQHDCIDEECILYFPEKHLFTKEQFNLLFNGLGSYAENKNKIGKEVDNPFEHKVYYLKHHDLNVVLRTMWGQGTMRQMRTGLPKEWVEELSFTIEEYLDWVKEK